ncbi:MAG TPA: UpxY family transcription antiterminator [Terriglobia bacterium]|nr:UpxY family transcription antiterminator [Terriglobia bacterium]
MNLQWYALHVRSRFEKHVESHLTGKGYEVFLPSYVSRRRWSDRVKAISLPLFPSYVFCRFDVTQRLPILVTPGVNFVVGSAGPEAINDSEIAAIRLVQDSGIAARPWPYLRTGAMVRIEDGPLEGLSGIILREKGLDRLIVSVSLLMRSVSVEVPRCSVKPLGMAGVKERAFAVVSSTRETVSEQPMTEVGHRIG